MAARSRTHTSTFGVGRREGHDASGFYRRFTPPVIDDDDGVTPPVAVDEVFCGDARHMTDAQVADSSVALMVTSPPYFAGKAYETALGQGVVPADYLSYLDLLRDVFAVCATKLEPGGRMAVNVANLGRRPYRSLAADVVAILQDELGMLLRGEIVWVKAKKLGGSCAWGSFQSAANPVLRDTTERVIVASKGRFDRARSRRDRALENLPSDGTMFKDDFIEATTDVWDLPPESATRVGHPAPFPVALPQRLIELYTYRGDLVLDPFIGSGSTAVAALRAERHFVGFDTEPEYVEGARARLDAERAALGELAHRRDKLRVQLPAIPSPPSPDESPHLRAVREGQRVDDIAVAVLEACGFSVARRKARQPSGVEIDLVLEAADGSVWHADVSGAFTSGRPGLRRADTLWKALGRAAVRDPGRDGTEDRFLLLTTHLPPRLSPGWKALTEARRRDLVFDAVELLADEGRARLVEYGRRGADAKPWPELHEPEMHVL